MPQSEHPPIDAEPGSRRRRPSRKITRLLATIAALAVVALVTGMPTTSSNPNAASEPSAASEKVEPTPRESPRQPAQKDKATDAIFYQQIPPPPGSPLAKVAPLALTVKDLPVGTSLNKGTVGISLEATDLADPALSAENASMVKLLKGSDSTVLRFGGNSVDRRFFWTSSGEALPKNYKGDKSHPAKVVTPADLHRVSTLLNATNARISLTVDLGHYNPQRAADMIKNASRIFGPRLLSFTVGNEPNGFAATKLRPAKYGIKEYVTQLKAPDRALRINPDR